MLPLVVLVFSSYSSVSSALLVVFPGSVFGVDTVFSFGGVVVFVPLLLVVAFGVDSDSGMVAFVLLLLVVAFGVDSDSGAGGSVVSVLLPLVVSFVVDSGSGIGVVFVSGFADLCSLLHTK